MPSFPKHITRRSFLFGLAFTGIPSLAMAGRHRSSTSAATSEGFGDGEHLWGEQIFDEPLGSEFREMGEEPLVEVDPSERDEALARAQSSRVPPMLVPYPGYEIGTIVVDTAARRLYLIEASGMAWRYGVAVGKEGFQWKGSERISEKKEWPSWTPPADMRKRRPELPIMMEGGLRNPLGARALYLGTTLYRIHGTNEPSSIGRSVSSGCIRMANADIIALYDRVPVGTEVVVK